jgi:hypothetical protein
VKQLGKGAEQVANQMQEVSARSGKAKSRRASGVKGKKRKAPRKQKKTSRIGQPTVRGNRRVGGDGGDEFDRLVVMVEKMRQTLERLVTMQPPVVPKELDSSIRKSWPRADGSFRNAIATLQDTEQRADLRPHLELAGFTGEMLDLAYEVVETGQAE